LKSLITSILVTCTLVLHAQVENGCISIDFETFPGETPRSGLELSDQYKDDFGLSFRLEGGGFPVLAQVGGDPAEAFGSTWGNDTPAPGVDIGQFFLTDDGQLAGLTSPPIILDFEVPIDSFAGCILDMDFGESFVIQAIDAIGNVILQDTIVAGDPGTGDGQLTCWGFNLPGCEGSIYSIRYAGFRTTAGAFGLGLDFFSFCYSGLQIDTETTPVTCESLGSVSIFSTTDEVYEYSLDGNNYSQNGFFDQLDQGVQTIFVRDSDNCITTVDVNIDLELEELPDPIIVDADICQGESFSFNGELYTDAGMYSQILPAANGCDTLWNLTLSVLPNSSEIISAEICDGETYELNGQSYTVGGTFQQMLMNEAACDSIIELNLSVNSSSFEDISVQLCDGEIYTLNGQTYDRDGFYTQELTNQNGCDSIISLQLQYRDITMETVNAQVCDGETLELNGQSYSMSGSFQQMLTNVAGCDSIIDINLDILQNTEETINDQVCEGDSYSLNGEIYSDAGSYTQQLSNQFGCDSILSLLLETIPSSIGSVSEEFCQGDAVSINGIMYDAAGSFSQTLVNQAGCDSLLSIEITVLPNIERCEAVSIFAGEVLTLNGESYDTAGTYEQLLQTADGCDSLVIIKLEVLPLPVALVHYDLNNCAAGGSSYDELTPRYDETLECADVTASILNRPSGLPHSCTPGVMGSGMCVTADPACSYQNDSPHRLVFNVYIDPLSSPVTIAGMNFFEKAPVNFEFNTGRTGTNNYPTFYSVKIIKNETVIYLEEDVITNREWTQQTFNFSGLRPFVFEESGMLTIEFLAYCPIGVSAFASAWDIDELSLFGYCQDESKSIEGFVMTTKVEPLEDVTIAVQDLETWEYYTTDALGDFAFHIDYDQYSVLIEPIKDDDHLNGVSTLDLIKIQRHILGTESFSSFSDLIAADINKDDQITAIDLIELRKLILGVYDNFPNNKSWRFLGPHKNYTTLSDVEDYMTIRELSNEINLEAIKVGDVNQSHTLTANKTYVDSRSLTNFKLILKKYRNTEGELSVGFYASKDIKLAGLQAALHVGDHKGLKLIPHQLDITAENYHRTSDLIKISWSNQNQEIQTGELLFEITYENSEAIAPIYLDSDFDNELYQSIDLSAHSLVLDYADDTRVNNKEDILQMYIHPNPVNYKSTIRVVSKDRQATQYEIIDAAGLLITSKSITLEAGHNKININRNEFPESGVYFVRVVQGEVVCVRRIVVF